MDNYALGSGIKGMLEGAMDFLNLYTQFQAMQQQQAYQNKLLELKEQGLQFDIDYKNKMFDYKRQQKEEQMQKEAQEQQLIKGIINALYNRNQENNGTLPAKEDVNNISLSEEKGTTLPTKENDNKLTLHVTPLKLDNKLFSANLNKQNNISNSNLPSIDLNKLENSIPILASINPEIAKQMNDFLKTVKPKHSWKEAGTRLNKNGEYVKVYFDPNTSAEKTVKITPEEVIKYHINEPETLMKYADFEAKTIRNILSRLIKTSNGLLNIQTDKNGNPILNQNNIKLAEDYLKQLDTEDAKKTLHELRKHELRHEMYAEAVNRLGTKFLHETVGNNTGKLIGIGNYYHSNVLNQHQ